MDSKHGPTLSRRRTLQGIAWATPALLVATAAPAAACSGRTGCDNPSYCDGTYSKGDCDDKGRRDCDATVTRSPGSDDANFCVTGITVCFTSDDKPKDDCVTGVSAGWDCGTPTSQPRTGGGYDCQVEIKPSTGTQELSSGGTDGCNVDFKVECKDVTKVQCDGYSDTDLGKVTMPTKDLSCKTA
ncbi:hypothetical protein [Demequina salsinemoris]|uniref:hypothetical protein n=1 Tax=Demequina salsinemoris TaxID=577470 RepID=UPI0007810A36|nr:hypothetical protein [Demequina salsinemoris]